MQYYGKELILDIHNCNEKTFTRESIEEYFKILCEKINMIRADLHFWDDLYTPEEEKETLPHLVGTSAIQFIKTSNITIHTLDIMKRVYLNIFSCKDFDEMVAEQFSVDWFGGYVVNSTVINRI
jgi:S-adenosylmethionine/arginine decarboxylase-like enzyme